MVVISYLYFVCFFFGGCCETACCGMGAQGFSNYKTLPAAKSMLLFRPTPYGLFLLDCLTCFGQRNCPDSEHLDHQRSRVIAACIF
jgi:hypothetical protein